MINVPAFLESRAAEIIGTEMNAALYAEESACRRNRWVVVLGLQPQRDGDQWCFLWGENLQVGVSAFGPTPIEAMIDFDRAMESAKGGEGKHE